MKFGFDDPISEGWKQGTLKKERERERERGRERERERDYSLSLDSSLSVSTGIQTEEDDRKAERIIEKLS